MALFFSGTLACTSKTSQVAPSPTPPVPETLLKSGQELSQTEGAEIPFKMYQLLSADPQNVCLSPLSLEQSLGLLYLGASGATKKQLQLMLNLPEETPYSLHQEKLGSSIELKWGNSIWHRPNRPINSSYIQTVKSKLDAQVFSNLEVAQINSWISKQTQGKITQWIEQLNLHATVLLINAFYLKAPWEKPFKKTKNILGPFQSSPHQASQVTYLHQTEVHPYYEDDSAKWTSLPYQGDHLVLFLALPKKQHQLRVIEEKLSSAYLKMIQSQMTPIAVDVRLPKFKIEAKLSLAKTLQNMGYTELLKKGDYSALSLNPLEISEILQGTVIQVDEDGTEAAAVTSTTLAITSVPKERSPEKLFHANEPFLFLLMNPKSQKIYLIGRVYSPRDQ